MPKKKEKTQETQANSNFVLARQDDGTVQITITIPQNLVSQVRESVLKQLIENTTIPGFRKGKAPTDLAMKQIDQQRVYEYTLQNILPDLYSQAVIEHKILPVLSPRFELISVEEGKDWMVRAITCEAPKVELKDYKSKISDLKKSDIWVPGKDQEKKEPSAEEKEQQVIKTLLETTEAKIPALLIEEEVNHRLSQLLDQVQRLGISVEQYLASTGRNIEQLKQEYAAQAQDSIKLVLALNKVAEEEKIDIADSEVDEVVKAGSNAISQDAQIDGKEKERYMNEQKRLVRSVLLRRKALESLLNLV